MANCDLLTQLPFYRLSNIELLNLLSSHSISGRGYSLENTDLYNSLTALNKSELLQDIKFSYYNTDEFNDQNRKLVDNTEISLFHLNIHSLNKNCSELYSFLQLIDTSFDIIVLSEIWSYNIDHYRNLFADYTFYYDLCQTSCVGGVGIYVKNRLVHKQLDALKISGTDECKVENVWLEVSTAHQKFIVGGVYRHPGQCVDKFASLFEGVLESVKKTKLPCLIAGDFNIDLMKYGIHTATNNYVDNLLLQNFFPTIFMPTRLDVNTATVIDHIYYSPGSKSSSNYIHSGNFWCDVTDHLPNYFMLVNHSKLPKKEQPRFVRLFSESNIKKFKDQIRNVDWLDTYSATDTDTAFDNFECMLTTCFNDCFPLVRLSRKHARDKKWMTAGIATSCRTKHRLFKKWMKSHNPNDEQKYKNYRAALKRLTTAAELSYYKEQFDVNANTVKQLWLNLNKIFSCKKPKSQTVITSLTVPGGVVTDTKDVCNSLNKYFSSVGDKLVQVLEKCDPRDFVRYCAPTNSASMFCTPTDPFEVHKVLMSFKSNKSPGADDISPKILKEISFDIIGPLAHIFNLSFISGTVPDSLKLAKVIPVFKKGDRTQPGNYRPISLLTVFDKILEKLMCKRLCNFLELHHILYDFQFGFRKHHSTALALMEVLDNIYEQLDKRKYIIGIYLDLQKAFDTVNHDILLYKLSNYGIRGVVHQWFKSYLTGRKQFTALGGFCSETALVSTGVPQGSVLGPLLFLLYINDIYKAIPNAKVKLFADDTNLFLCDKNLASLFSSANENLKCLHKWFVANKLSLNVTKTCYSVFGTNECQLQDLDLKLVINGENIERVDSCKYLGIIIDSDMSWKEHIDFVYKKIIKFTSIFYKIRTNLNADVLKMLYFAFVYPHLLYGIEIYGNTNPSNINRLKILNNKILRILQKRPRRTHVIDLYKSYSTLPIDLLHKYQILLFVHKYAHHSNRLPVVFASYFIQNKLIHQYDTRDKCDFHLSTPCSTFGKRSLKYKGSHLWNRLPESLKLTQSTPVFKSSLMVYLLTTV